MIIGAGQKRMKAHSGSAKDNSLVSERRAPMLVVVPVKEYDMYS